MFKNLRISFSFLLLILPKSVFGMEVSLPPLDCDPKTYEEDVEECKTDLKALEQIRQNVESFFKDRI